MITNCNQRVSDNRSTVSSVCLKLAKSDALHCIKVGKMQMCAPFSLLSSQTVFHYPSSCSFVKIVGFSNGKEKSP